MNSSAQRTQAVAACFVESGILVCPFAVAIPKLGGPEWLAFVCGAMIGLLFIGSFILGKAIQSKYGLQDLSLSLPGGSRLQASFELPFMLYALAGAVGLIPLNTVIFYALFALALVGVAVLVQRALQELDVAMAPTSASKGSTR